MIRKALIIAPLRVCHLVWPTEAAKWSDFNDLKIVVLHGKDKDMLLEDALPGADIAVINPDGLAWLLGAETITSPKTGRKSVRINETRFKKLGFDVLIVDELTMFKHSSSIRFKMMRHIIDHFGRRWGMTATPSANRIMDLFGQMYIVDGGRSLGQYITHFRNAYFTQGYDGFSYIPQEGAEEKIYNRIAPLVLRMSSDDYLDLPDLITDVIEVDIGAKARVTHGDMLEDLIAKIGRGEVVAANAGVATGKCRQITSGAIYKDDGVAYTKIHTAKLEALEELIDRMNGQPLLVAYEFRHEVERIKKHLKMPELPTLGGGVSNANSAKIERLWNNNMIPVLLAHPQSVGHGLNLQGGSASHICWFTLTWDNELHQQMNGRLRRRGTKATRIFAHYLLAQGTVDRAVYGAIRSKEKGQEALFEALKKLCKTRK